MTIKTLEDAFVDELRDLLSAEKQIAKGLRRIIKTATNAELKQCFEEHLKQTEGQIDRLEMAFSSIGRIARSRKCEGMQGILEEGRRQMDEKAESHVRDAVLIGLAQKVEHYQIAAYGTVCTWAEMLESDQAARLLHENLAEKKAADQRLTRIAREVVNQEALAVT